MYVSPFGAQFSDIRTDLTYILSTAEPIRVGEWQSQKVSHPAQDFLEAENVIFQLPVPHTAPAWAEQVSPNLPWAEKHFQERVSGIPMNPPPSAKEWPFVQAGHGGHIDSQAKFSHTYPERFWPKRANPEEIMQFPNGRRAEVNVGIRFAYGDLADVVKLLSDRPLTRQAYLPVWFPEDTGTVHGKRVPCTLGYHFQIREDKLNCTYLIRSCDFYRHFADDVYMAGRLMQWMASPQAIDLDDIEPGTLTMHIMNLHTFAGEQHRLAADLNMGRMSR